MDISAITESQLQVWVQFDEETEVLIEYVPRHELLKIYKKSVVVKYKNHQKVEEYSQETGDKLLGLAAVKDWRPIPPGKGFTLNSEPFPCTPENVETLMVKWNEFSRFVHDHCSNLAALVERDKEDFKKKSSATSGQS